VITPVDKTIKSNLTLLEEIVRSLGSNVYYCSPEQHDRAVSWISHLPVMVSAALIDACLNETDLEILELAQKLASSGFRDTSRVGGGNPELGVMMAQYNSQALINSLHQYRDHLDLFIKLIEEENWEVLGEKLLFNQHNRPRFL
jgi:arogenate dehydrogenase (NADP+)